MQALGAYLRLATLDPTAQAFYHGPLFTQSSFRLKALSVSSFAILHVTARSQNLEHELRVHSLLLPFWMTLLVCQGSLTQTLQGFVPHLLRQDCRALCVPRAPPAIAALTGFIAREGNLALKALRHQPISCADFSYYPRPAKATTSGAVLYITNNSTHDHNSVESVFLL